MRITVDLDPKDVWEIEERSERDGISKGEALRRLLAEKRTPAVVIPKRPDRIGFIGAVREMWAAGMCDAEIAARLETVNQEVAATRRQLGLVANRMPANYERKSAE